MASFNITSGTTTTQQSLTAGETGRVAAGATLNTPMDSAVSINTGAFNGTLASPTLDNAGIIRSGIDTIYLDSTASGTIYIRNTGTIRSTATGVYAIFGVNDSGATVLDNAGPLISADPITVFLASGDDIFVVRNGSSTTGLVEAFNGTDTLYYGLWTGTGVTVTLEGAATGMASNTHFENVYGSAQGDSIMGEGSVNVLNGLDGNDMLSGLAGNDTLFGANGNDTLMGGDDNDLFYGGAGSDSMVGGAGDDTYQVTDSGDFIAESASEGTDSVFATVSWTATTLNIETIYAVGSGLTLTGTSGPDTLVADAIAGSTLRGGSGPDTLWGQAGADSLSGGASSDTLRGGAGNDTLSGDAGDDQLIGGLGADTFAFATSNWGYDQIFDFVSGTDRLDMRGSGATFATLTFYGDGSSTAVMLGAARIDVYGVGSLTASDFIFS